MPHPHVLVIRLSAIGDIAMAAAVVRQAAVQLPDATFTMISQPFMHPLFTGLPNVRFIGVDERADYRGLRGLWRLFRVVRQQRPDRIADLHDVLRTQVLRGLLRLSGKRVSVIRKGRAARRRLTRRRHKVRRPLKTTFERYREVIEKCVGQRLSPDAPVAAPDYAPGCIVPKKPKAVGIAPFAACAGKIYPLEKMQEVVACFAACADTDVFLFGGGRRERAILEEWAQRYPPACSIAGKLSLADELALIRRLSVMISMDSANMHFASFVGTPVVSVWGATHPCAGFYGWQQAPDNAVCAGLPCSPCSIYGNKPCFRRDYRCLHSIPPAAIIARANTFL
ncbi:MAG: glycosyltransferase family 9 protein [Prevotellaceae bacterium]|jgi:ADP-heptose:LPS heptosyltransferase|nr:glycosyltransferase family 9 protein [Prevotellaceae bacterium]